MVHNIEKCCRICLKEVQRSNRELINSQNVANELESTEKTWTYLELFHFCSGFTILLGEPQHFCKSCAEDLKKAFAFKIRCEETQKFLESIETSEIKVEIKEDATEKLEESIVIHPNFSLDHDSFKDENGVLTFDSSIPDEPAAHNQLDETFIDFEDSNDTYMCDLCSATCKSRKNLMQHYKAFHSNQKHHECVHCKNTFYSTIFLESHSKTCKKRPRSDKNLNKKQHLCPVCGKPSSNNHILYHTQRQVKQDANSSGTKQIFICDVCGTKVSTRYSMINHMKVQHFNQRTKCKYCDTTFRYPTQLSLHVRRIHRQEQPVFKCGKCDFIAPSETYLQRHRTTHSGKKPFNCTICNYECFKKIEFENHLASHSDARPFICEICNSAFKTKKALRTHKKTHGEYDYECPVCSQGFYSNHLMRAHVKKAHPEYELPPPGTIFSKTALKRQAEKEMQEIAMRSGTDKNIKLDESDTFQDKIEIN